MRTVEHVRIWPILPPKDLLPAVKNLRLISPYPHCNERVDQFTNRAFKFTDSDIPSSTESWI